MSGNSKAARRVHGRPARRRWPAPLVVLLCASAAPSFAQAPADPAPLRPPRWSLALDAHEGWDSNVRFFAPGGPSDTFTRLDAKLDREWFGPRGRFTLSGAGQGFLYRRVSDLSHFAYGGDADGSFLLSPRAVVRLSDTFRTTYASELAALTQAGLLLPPVNSRVNTARAGFSYSVSRRTTATVDLQHEIVSFDSPSLVPGSRLRADAGLSHDLSRTDTVGASYQFQRMMVRDDHSNTQTLEARWTHAFGARAHARIRGGATRFQLLTAPSSPRTTAVGGASLDARWGRQTIEAQYDRVVDLAYGLGRVRINELLSGRYAVSLTSDLGLDVRAVQGRGRDPADVSFELTTTDLAASLRYVLTRNLALAGTYTRRRVSESPLPPVSSQGAALFVSYRQAWP